MSKINYRIHTDAVKEFLIESTLSPQEMAYTYASEADILNMALFGKTAAQWRNEKGISGKIPNIRDFASFLVRKIQMCMIGVKLVVVEMIKTRYNSDVELSIGSMQVAV